MGRNKATLLFNGEPLWRHQLDLLRSLAADTDGRAILSAGDLAAGLPRLAGDAIGYYLLTFRPAHPTEPARFHPIEVRVKRPNVTVHGRKGYWSASPDDLWRARLATRESAPKPPEPARSFRLSPPTGPA